jgi:hypothetical protein
MMPFFPRIFQTPEDVVDASSFLEGKTPSHACPFSCAWVKRRVKRNPTNERWIGSANEVKGEDSFFIFIFIS